MACRHPMWATAKYNIQTGKYEDVKFVGSVEDCPNAENYKSIIKLKPYYKLLQLPCGQCVECRLKHASEWANRCMKEAEQYTNNYFITLTYNDENLPHKNAIDVTTGELYETETLMPKHLQLFLKNLRITWKRKFGAENIRFFACGEYGEKYKRPHYHIILFNCPIPDLNPSHKSKRGNMNYTSKLIEEVWGRGRIAVGTVTWESCAYTARYVMKKITGQGAKEFYRVEGKEPEFVRMSRKPGIARNFYEQKKDTIYEVDEYYVSTKKGVRAVKPARYYDKLFDIDEPIKMKKIKEHRQSIAKILEENKTNNTDRDINEIRQIARENKDLAIKALKRKYDSMGAM